MIYEVRTYSLRTGAVAEFEDRFAKRKPLREKHSKLGGMWHTEFGPLNQIVHIWPYNDLAHRTAVRDATAKDAELSALPGGRDLIVAQEADILIPAPFMQPPESRNLGKGNVYEMRIYTYEPGAISKVLEAWARRCPVGRSSRPWSSAGAPSLAGSTSGSTCGPTRISTSACASARSRARAASGPRSPASARSSRRTRS